MPAAPVRLPWTRPPAHRRGSRTDSYGAESGEEIRDRCTAHLSPSTDGCWLNHAETATGLFSAQRFGSRKIPSLKTPRPRNSSSDSPYGPLQNQDQLKVKPQSCPSPVRPRPGLLQAVKEPDGNCAM